MGTLIKTPTSFPSWMCVRRLTLWTPSGIGWGWPGGAGHPRIHHKTVLRFLHHYKTIRFQYTRICAQLHRVETVNMNLIAHWGTYRLWMFSVGEHNESVFFFSFFLMRFWIHQQLFFFFCLLSEGYQTGKLAVWSYSEVKHIRWLFFSFRGWLLSVLVHVERDWQGL